ncbi:MAG: hypothetical protein DMG32_13870 [Acidobacteria bacterium]|nr:MAG: hypothetical protein DMG32_13870 [Acidobacteriota bacterium]
MLSSAPCYSSFKRIFDAYGMIWGADVTRLTYSYTDCLDHVRRSLDFLSLDDKEWILGKTLAEALNWPEARPETSVQCDGQPMI